jgi:DNA gyrase/topoisomerase IV subunit A
MRLAPGDRIVAACAVGPGDLVVVHESGHGKRVDLADVPAKGRGTGGVQLASPDKPSKEPAGPVAAIRCADGPAGAILLSGQIAKVPAETAVNRAAVSRPLVDIVVGDEAVGLA